MVCARCLRHDLCSILVGIISTQSEINCVSTNSYLLITFAQYVLFTVIFIPEESTAYKVVNIVIFECFTFLAFSAHLRTMFTDPVSQRMSHVDDDNSGANWSDRLQGAVPRGTATKEAVEQLGLIDGQVLYKCTKCCSIKPERAHHCSVCQRCIRKMDHHCPWVNNCVGENNQKFFVLFTVRLTQKLRASNAD